MIKILLSVRLGEKRWTQSKLAKKTLTELVSAYEEAGGYDKATAIGIILSGEAPMTDEELYSSDYDNWQYVIDLDD